MPWTELITDTNRGNAYDGPVISEEEHEVTLHAERPVVDTEAVPSGASGSASRPSPTRRPSAATSARSRSRSTTPSGAAVERGVAARRVYRRPAPGRVAA
jgi:hypothetical protein